MAKIICHEYKCYSHYRSLRPTENVDASVHIFSATALERRKVSNSMPGRFYPPGKPSYSFYRRQSVPHHQSGH